MHKPSNNDPVLQNIKYADFPGVFIAETCSRLQGLHPTLLYSSMCGRPVNTENMGVGVDDIYWLNGIRKVSGGIKYC